MRFPTGGIVRERASAGPDSGAGQDLVKFQNRQYSLDERRWQDAGSSLRLCVQMVQTALECFYIPEFFIPQAEVADNRGCSKKYTHRALYRTSPALDDFVQGSFCGTGPAGSIILA